MLEATPENNRNFIAALTDSEYTLEKVNREYAVFDEILGTPWMCEDNVALFGSARDIAKVIVKNVKDEDPHIRFLKEVACGNKLVDLDEAYKYQQPRELPSLKKKKPIIER